MKFLLAGLIAGLLLSLSLSAQAADSTKLKCTLANGEQIETRTVEVTDPAMTSMDFEARGVTFTASAIYNMVNVYAKIGGTSVGNSGRDSASLDVFPEGRESLGFSCELIVHVDHWCSEI